MKTSTLTRKSGLLTLSFALKLIRHRVALAAVVAACSWGSLIGALSTAATLATGQIALMPTIPRTPPTNPTFVRQGTFNTSGQNIWNSGQANSINYKKFIGADWNAQKYTAKKKFEDPVFGQEIGRAFAAGMLNEGRLGLEANLKLDAGSMNVNFPVRSSFSAPAVANGGDRITIDTGYSVTNGLSMNTSGPGADFKLDLVGEAKVTYGAGYDLVGAKTWTTSTQDNGDSSFSGWNSGSLFDRHRNDKTLINTGGEKRMNLLHMGSGITSQSVDISDWGTLTFQVPEVVTSHDSTLNAAGELYTSTTSGNWVSFEADIVKLAGEYFPVLKTLSGKKNVGPYIDLEYSILSADLELDLRLRQEYTFQAESIDVTMVEKNSGLTVSGQLGDDLSVNVPWNATELDWDVTLQMNGQFTNRTSLVLVGGFDYELLKATAKIDDDIDLIGGSKIGEVGPVFEGGMEWELAEIPVYERTFAVQGFNTLEFDYRSTTVTPSSSPATRMPMLSLSSVPEPNSICCGVVALILLASSRSPRQQPV